MEDLSRYYTLLRDPTRRKIIEILGSQEKIGFKELRQALNLGVGTVYYHLDMLSGFLTQDKQRKYKLNESGQALFKILKDGEVPATLRLDKTFSHRFGRWVFLSPIFAKTSEPIMLLPASVALLILGAAGSAVAGLDPALFFYLLYSSYSPPTIMVLYVSNWIGMFLFAELMTYILYRRVGNELQLFTCIGIASFPLALFPYIFMVAPVLLLGQSSADLDLARQYILIALQIWGLLLSSTAFCYGKGIRLDKSIVVTLTVVYLNISILFLLGRLA